MGGIGGFFKSLKKKITLKGIIRTVAKVGAALPVVGGFLQDTAGAAAAATEQAQQAQAATEAQIQQAQVSGTFQRPPSSFQPLVGPGGFTIDAKTALIAGAALVAVFLLARRR